MAEARRIVATAALPYANGPIHIGHLVEYLQTDFWTRFQKMRGHECLYICADDTHGTPILVRARKEKVTPESIIEKSWEDHFRDFSDFEIKFDHFGSTNSPENKKLVEEIFQNLKDKGHIEVKKIDQLYCEHDKMFLPDRFVKGTCPKCKSADQYGDSCDKCSATYNPSDLIEPQCTLCGSKPVIKSSDHLLFQLNNFKEFLQKWVPEHTQKEISHKLNEWFNEDLRPWDISRDEPYFGFKIPGYDDKYFYVWVDAPIGYIASTQEWCLKNNRKLEDFWSHKNSEIYHFIGKDITYFHSLFWPAMLSCTRFKLPKQICVHGMLTVDGEKMSKSKGTSIFARTYLNHLDPMYLRYYYATKLTQHPDDIDLNLTDFTQRVNSDLIGKITNLGSRGAQMLTKKLDGIITEPLTDGLALIREAQARAEAIAQLYEARDFSKVITEIRSIADMANKFFDEKAPWKLLESDIEEAKSVVSTSLIIFRLLAIYLKPILPKYVENVEKLFGEKTYNWFDTIKLPLNIKLNEYTHLATRVDPEKVQKIIDETKKFYESQEKVEKTNVKKSDDNGLIDFEQFAQVDLRVVKIIEAEEIKEADKLLKLKVDLGNGITKQIIAGIKSAYTAKSLIGRYTVIVANLKPRTMKFGISEGMVLAAGAGGKELFILSPDSGAKPGDKVK